MHVTIMKKYGSPKISISIQKEGMSIGMTMEDFLKALADESCNDVSETVTKAADGIVEQAANDSGNPFWLMTNAQLVKRLTSALDSDQAKETIANVLDGETVRTIFANAAERVFSAMKRETIKVV